MAQEVDRQVPLDHTVPLLVQLPQAVRTGPRQMPIDPLKLPDGLLLPLPLAHSGSPATTGSAAARASAQSSRVAAEVRRVAHS